VTDRASTATQRLLEPLPLLLVQVDTITSMVLSFAFHITRVLTGAVRLLYMITTKI
jgi:hypothetical protein